MVGGRVISTIHHSGFNLCQVSGLSAGLTRINDNFLDQIQSPAGRGLTDNSSDIKPYHAGFQFILMFWNSLEGDGN